MYLKAIEWQVEQLDEINQSDSCQLLLKTYAEYYKQIGYHVPWIGYFVVKDHETVGSCGFKGQPKDGKVEIAYWTFDGFEGQGIASFSGKELVSICEQTDPAITIIATTAPEHNASTRILTKNGFLFSAIVQDHEIGDAWEWSLSKTSADADG